MIKFIALSIVVLLTILILLFYTPLFVHWNKSTIYRVHLDGILIETTTVHNEVKAITFDGKIAKISEHIRLNSSEDKSINLLDAKVLDELNDTSKKISVTGIDGVSILQVSKYDVASARIYIYYKNGGSTPPGNYTILKSFTLDGVAFSLPCDYNNLARILK